MTRKFVCTPDFPVVQTTQGKIRGFQLDDLFVFHGVPYADAERFQAPHPMEPWEGIRDAHSYGFVCPLMDQDVPNKELLVPHRFWPMDEHCLSLNLWTPSLNTDAKKPVMVWLHGGGFSAGSSIEHVAYEGDHLASYGDVVVITVNHRLNVLGYLDLSAFGEKYANSANAGTADLVACLEWVRDNVANFGGDPDNVTIFGQSGGGAKVTMLMNTPAAEGLFHKGIIQSGVMNMGVSSATDGKPIVEAMLSRLGLTPDQVEELETLPYSKLVETYKAVVPEIADQNGYLGNYPVPNEWWPGDPLEVGFTKHARTIPVLVGSVMGEFCFEPGVQNKYDMSDADVIPLLRDKYGNAVDKLIPQFRKAYPDKHLSDLLYLDTYFRVPTHRFIQRRVEECSAPTYAFRLTYDFPIDGGKVAWHCSEIPFVFHNTDRAGLFNVPGVTDRLEERICSAFVNFARYGNPSVASLPAWPACSKGDESTMIFDTTCEVRHNFDTELIHTLDETGATPSPTLLGLILPEQASVVVVH